MDANTTMDNYNQINTNSTTSTSTNHTNRTTSNSTLSHDEETAVNVVASLSASGGMKRDATQAHSSDYEIMQDSDTKPPANKIPKFDYNSTGLNGVSVNVNTPPVDSSGVGVLPASTVESSLSSYFNSGGPGPASNLQMPMMPTLKPAVVAPSMASTSDASSMSSKVAAAMSQASLITPPLSNETPTQTNDNNNNNNDNNYSEANLQLVDSATTGDIKGRTLLPSPFFYYRNFSTVIDEDPLTPLTPLARVPNFPAKMHAILSRPDLADVVAWMPHGRSWRVLKPREFEIRIIPTYFEHQKFSSFIRQANGWGFRRITQGRDRNSYYHELFLRGLPHLCKKMKRPGVNKKLTVDAEHEPDFYEISEMHSLPGEFANRGGAAAGGNGSAGAGGSINGVDDNILLPCTLMGGPKARMPVGFSGMNVAGASGSASSTAANGVLSHFINNKINGGAEENHAAPSTINGAASGNSGAANTILEQSNKVHGGSQSSNAAAAAATTLGGLMNATTATHPSALASNMLMGHAASASVPNPTSTAANGGLTPSNNVPNAATNAAAAFAAYEPNDFISLSALQQAIQLNFDKLSNSRQDQLCQLQQQQQQQKQLQQQQQQQTQQDQFVSAAGLKSPSNTTTTIPTPTLNSTAAPNHHHLAPLLHSTTAAQQSHILAAASLQAANQQAEAVRQAASALQLAMSQQQQPQHRPHSHHSRRSPSISSVADVSQSSNTTSTPNDHPTANGMGSDAASQFAAGFAAATAMSDSNIRLAVNQALSSHAAAKRQAETNNNNNGGANNNGNLQQGVGLMNGNIVGGSGNVMEGGGNKGTLDGLTDGSASLYSSLDGYFH